MNSCCIPTSSVVYIRLVAPFHSRPVTFVHAVRKDHFGLRGRQNFSVSGVFVCHFFQGEVCSDVAPIAPRHSTRVDRYLRQVH